MKRLSAHIFIELVAVFCITIGSLLGLLLVGRMLQLRELFLAQSLGFLEIAELFFYLSPFFLLLLMPVGCMLAVFLTFLRMSTDRELVALKSGGVSLYQLLGAPLVFCLLATLMGYWISVSGLSWGMDQFRGRVLEYARTKTQLMLQPGVFNRDFTGLTLFAEKVEDSGSRMQLVFVRDETRKGVSATVIAPEGVVATDPNRGEILILLKNGHIYRRQGDTLDVLGFDSYVVRLDIAQIFRGYDLDDVRPKEMSLARLLELSGKPPPKGEDENFTRKVRVEIQKRLALPLACLVLGMFALPFGCAFRGIKQYMGLILAMGFFLIYQTLVSLGLSLGETGILNPAVGLWTPDAIFAVLAVAGIRMTARERLPRVAELAGHFWSNRKSAHDHNQDDNQAAGGGS